MTNSPIRRSRTFPNLVPVLLIVPAFIAPSAHAQSEQRVLRPYAGLSATWDSNVLGLSGPAEALALTGSSTLSDTARSLVAGVVINKTLGRQRLAAKLDANRTRFDRLSQLDYQGYGASADWLWALGNDWDGKAGYSRTYTLAPFTNFHSPERNTYTVERTTANARWLLASDWRLRAGASRYGVDYELPLQRRFNRKENGSEIGIDYLARSGNLISLQWRRSDGRFPNLVDGQASGFRQDQLELKANWQLSGKTNVDFVGGRVKRVHPGESERDFHGYNGRVTTKMTVSGKTILSASIWRETGVFDDASTSYSTNRGANLAGRWAVTDKTSIEGSWSRERRDFTRPLRLAALPDYRDTLKTAQLSLSYAASTHVDMQLGLVRSNKLTSNGFGEYGRRAATALARYRF